MEVIDLDVLVVGGGAQGLWVVNDLNELGYRVILIERTMLGGGQTCHSHGLIHRGHFYYDSRMMIVLNAAAQFWAGFLTRRGLKPLNKTRAIVGFGPGRDVDRHTYMWDRAGLRYKPVNQKKYPFLKHVHHLFETDELSIDTAEMMSRLSSEVLHCLYRIDDDKDALKFVQTDRKITEVSVTIEGKQVNLRPQLVILCAGEGNLEILEALGGGLGRDSTVVQACRKHTMLCLRSKELPQMTAVFPAEGGLRGLFMCSRVCPDTANTVWLISDNNSVDFRPGVGYGDPNPQPIAIDRLIKSLEFLSPEPLKAADMEACVYTGLTAERESSDGSRDCHVEPFDFDNVLTIWPAKLTLTPFASNLASRFVRARLSLPKAPGGKNNRWPAIGVEAIRAIRPEVVEETWRKEPFSAPTSVKTAWKPFGTFRTEFGIP
jgi:hypothetical protein